LPNGQLPRTVETTNALNAMEDHVSAHACLERILPDLEGVDVECAFARGRNGLTLSTTTRTRGVAGSQSLHADQNRNQGSDQWL
jgi:hypothetical protein